MQMAPPRKSGKKKLLLGAGISALASAAKVMFVSATESNEIFISEGVHKEREKLKTCP